MKTLVCLVAASFALLLLAPSATAECPPEQPGPSKLPRCTESPILVSVGDCVSHLTTVANDWQVFVGETIACL